MLKIVAILKRKPGMSFEEFRERYETSHVELAKKYFGHLMVEYRRNYLPSAPSVAESDLEASGSSSGPDVVTEICLRDEEAYAEFTRIFSDPAILKILQDDEATFQDRSASCWGIAQVLESQLPSQGTKQ